MVEALVRHLAGERFEVLSAGLRPGDVHPLTRQVIEAMGTGTSGLRSKGLESVIGRIGIKYAVVVCEEGEVECPRIYPFAVQTLQDPARPRWAMKRRAGARRRVLLARLLTRIQ